MNVWTLRSLVAAGLMLVSLPVVAQSVRYEWQGAAYIVAEDQLITERVVDRVLGTATGSDAQVVFFRPTDQAPGELKLSSEDSPLARLPSGAYSAVAVAPGSHRFAVDGDSLSLEVAAGERKYVKVSGGRANPQLSQTNALTFLRMATGKRKPLYLY